MKAGPVFLSPKTPLSVEGKCNFQWRINTFCSREQNFGIFQTWKHLDHKKLRQIFAACPQKMSKMEFFYFLMHRCLIGPRRCGLERLLQLIIIIIMPYNKEQRIIFVELIILTLIRYNTHVEICPYHSLTVLYGVSEGL